MHRMRMCETIEGPDSEELLSELLRLYGDRPVIKFHRAVMNNDITSVTEPLENHPEWIESTLMPIATYEEVAKCNEMDYDAFLEFQGVVPQASNYPVVQQFVSGLTEDPNELYPSGKCDEPESNLDTVFWTPLFRACVSGNPEMAALLVKKGANRDYRSPCGANVIWACLQSIRRDTIVENLALVRTDANVLFADYLGQVIWSHRATPELIQGLLDIGVSVDKNNGLFQGDWRKWMNPEIVAVLEPHLA
jgi:hypothetical protein